MPAASSDAKKAQSSPNGNGGIASSLRLVLIGSLAAGALMYGVGSLIVPRYTAEARLALAPKGKPAERLSPDALQRQARAAHTPEIVGDVVQQLKLAEKVEFNRALGFPDTWTKLLAMAGLAPPAPGTEKEQVRAAVLKVSEAAALVDAGQLAVRFRATEPELAAKGANALAAAYIASLGQAAPQPAAAAVAPAPAPAAPPAAVPLTAQPSAAVKELTQRVTALAAEIAAYENEQARLQAEAPQKPKAAPVNDARVTELSRLKAARTEADQTLKAARDAIKTGNVDVLAELQKSPSVQTLLQERVRLERQITELSASLLPEHPRMQQLNAKLASFKREIAVVMAKSVEKLERDAKVAQAREESVRKTLDELTAVPVAQPQPNDTKLRQIDTALKDRRAELDRVKAELAEAEKAKPAPAPQPTAPPVVATPAPAPAPAAATAPAGSASPAIEAKVVAQATAAGLMPVPDKNKLAALAAVMTFGAGMVLSLLKSLVLRLLGRGARPALPARKLPANLAETAAGEKIAGKSAKPAAASAPPAPAAEAKAKSSSVAAAVAAIGAKLGKGKAAGKGSVKAADAYEPPVSPPEPRAVSHAESYELEGEAHCNAARLDEIAARILARPVGDIGIRSLVTGADDALDPEGEALGLARRLVAGGKSVVLVGWSPAGEGLAQFLGIAPAPGLNEMLVGRATFEDVVQCLLEVDGNELHAIAAGDDLEGKIDALDPDVVNLVLDALDEVYDHIVVVGRHDEAKDLFEAILGRFDIGVLVHEQDRPAPSLDGTFLDFEVTDIETMTCVRPELDDAPAPMSPPNSTPPAGPAGDKSPSSAKAAAAHAPADHDELELDEVEPPRQAKASPVAKVEAKAPAPAKDTPASKMSGLFSRGKKPSPEDDKPLPVSQAAIARALRTTSSGRSASTEKGQ